MHSKCWGACERNHTPFKTHQTYEKKRWDDIKEKICWALNLNMRYYTQISNNIKCSQARTHKYSTTQQMHQNRWTFCSFSFQTSSIVLIWVIFLWLLQDFHLLSLNFPNEWKKCFFSFFPHFLCVFNSIKWTFFTRIHSQALQYDSVLHFCALYNKNIFQYFNNWIFVIFQIANIFCIATLLAN